MKRNQKIYSIAAVVIVIDIMIKLLVITKLQENELIEVIPDFFSIFYVKNTGAAFSILQNMTVFLIILSVIIIIILHRYIKSEEKMSRYQEFSLGLIIGGIFGNMIDRIIYHGVIDYLSFKIFNYNFPVFNIADVAITLGAIVLIISLVTEVIKDRINKK